MTALEETQIRIKVYEELIADVKEVFGKDIERPGVAAVLSLLDGRVDIESKLIEEFKLEEG